MLKNPHILTQAMLAILIGIDLCDRFYPATPAAPSPAAPPAPAPGAAVNGVTLGRAYVPVLGATYGEAWQAAAKVVADGSTIADAQKVVQDTWRDARERAFASQVAPAFARVLPEGAEPSTPEKRAEVARLFSDFGRGLKGGR